MRELARSPDYKPPDLARLRAAEAMRLPSRAMVMWRLRRSRRGGGSAAVAAGRGEKGDRGDGEKRERREGLRATTTSREACAGVREGLRRPGEVRAREE